MSPRSITVHVHMPPGRRPWLATNRRDHHHARAQLVRSWRERAMLSATQTRERPLASPFTVRAVIRWPDRRRRDLDGGAPTVKACLDGIQDAGLIAGDDHRHMVQLTLAAEVASPNPGVTITITEQEAP